MSAGAKGGVRSARHMIETEIEMAKTPDYTATFKDFFGAFPADFTAYQDAFKSSASFGEKFSKLALDAAEKSTDLTSKWTKDTIAKLGDVAKAKAEPADYGKAVSEFAAGQSEMVTEYVSAFGEMAKQMQSEALELMLAAGRKASEDTTAAVKKAGLDVQAAAKKAGASVAA